MKLHLFKTLFAVVALTSLAVSARAAGSLEQCANGSDGLTLCTGAAWVTGNVNASKGAYLEGDVMPYRFVMTGHAAGAGHLEVQWDTFKSGSHATDYITTWDTTETGGDPCMDAFGGGCGAAATIGIPSPSPDAPAGEPVGAVFTIWGGTFTGIDAYMQTGDTDAGQTSIRVDFTTAGGTVVIAWGGHISKFSEWDPKPRPWTFLVPRTTCASSTPARELSNTR